MQTGARRGAAYRVYYVSTSSINHTARAYAPDKEEDLMDLGITGRVAVVTGAARGIGRADAAALAAEGAKVVLIDILADELQQAVADITAAGGQAWGKILDITDREAVKGTLETIKNDIGPVAILVNNAAIIGTVGQLKNYRDAAWDNDINVNLTGSYNMTRYAFPQMLEQGWGRIIFMSSIAGLNGGFGQTSYATTKAGVIGMAKSIALEGARKGITANVVAPGIIETDAFKSYDPAMIERMVSATAMRRLGTPMDIANTITFLCSQQAAYTTGGVVTVAGGLDLFVF